MASGGSARATFARRKRGHNVATLSLAVSVSQACRDFAKMMSFSKSLGRAILEFRKARHLDGCMLKCTTCSYIYHLYRYRAGESFGNSEGAAKTQPSECIYTYICVASKMLRDTSKLSIGRVIGPNELTLFDRQREIEK